MLRRRQWGLFFGIICAFFLMLILCNSNDHEQNENESGENNERQNVVNCYEYRTKRSWWTYSWCDKQSLEQIRSPRVGKPPIEQHSIGTYREELSLHKYHQFYENSKAECTPDGQDKTFKRTGEVQLRCCNNDSEKIKLRRKSERKLDPVFIDTVVETKPCHYVYTVCSQSVCDDLEYSDNPHDTNDNHHGINFKTEGSTDSIPEDVNVKTDVNGDESIKEGNGDSTGANKRRKTERKSNEVTPAEQMELKEKVREMFYHGYDSYMKYAFPQSDLKPISCTGQKFELIKIPLVTLIDTLDTLVILGNNSEFKRAVHLVSQEITTFNYDTSVSVFETTIRVLGGLLSAHLFAIDPLLKIYSGSPGDVYDGNLLRLAIDIGDRLLPAFRTNTGIPYGTVNLMKGVPKGETEISSTAGAGSLLLEFEVLSCVSGDPKYGLVAMRAVEELYRLRSELDLVGKHIHIRTGKWHETISGVGSNSDSFYEYLLKSYLLFRKTEHYRMFQDVYYAVKRHTLAGDWFVDVDMYSGKVRNKRSENLQAFWPGVEALMGMNDASGRLLNAFYLVWSEVGFLPEEFDYVNWATNGNKGFVSLLYPLRPELIESTYIHYRATGDRSWLLAGRDFLESLEKYSKTECGYATVKDVTKRLLEDNMPSFFLSETCKYLYLLYDEENFVHTHRQYIFTTEAHPIDPVQLSESCSYHLDQMESKLTGGGGIGSGSGSGTGGNQSWSDIIIERVLSTLTGGSTDEEIEATQDDIEVNILETDELEVEVNELDPTDTSLEDRRRKETDIYNDWIFGKELHPHYLQCPKSHWWNILSYRPGVSTRSGSTSSSSSPSQQQQQLQQQQEESKGKYLDISEFLKLLSQQPYVDPFDPNTVCGVDDDIKDLAGATGTTSSSTSNSGKGLSGGGGGGPQKITSDRTVEIEAGVMGKFTVNVFTDGFVINSHSFGNTIEIAGVGSPTLFVKEFNSTASSTIIGTGPILSTCNVRLHVNWPSEIWKKKGYNRRDFSPDELIKPRSCSHAAFGVTANPINFPKHPLYLNPTRAVDGTACLTPQRTDEDGVLESTSQSTTTGSSWFNWGKKKLKTDIPSHPYAGNVVIADRGGCMFEEKVIQAESGGAVGVIVINSESNLFMMSGIKSMDRKTEGDSDRQMAGKTTIPAVMLSNPDGRYLLDAIEYLGNLQIPLQVVVDLQSFPSIFDSPIMGYDSNHPSIRMSEKVVHIIGQSSWSIILTKTESNEWQLFIVPTKELQDLVPWTILTSDRLPISTNPAFYWNHNPVGIYQELISEQCPVDIEWTETEVIFQNKGK